jgi:hypothetical protein
MRAPEMVLRSDPMTKMRSSGLTSMTCMITGNYYVVEFSILRMIIVLVAKAIFRVA